MATSTDGAENNENYTTAIGTILYAPPEQLANNQSFSQHSNVSTRITTKVVLLVLFYVVGHVLCWPDLLRNASASHGNCARALQCISGSSCIGYLLVSFCQAGRLRPEIKDSHRKIIMHCLEVFFLLWFQRQQNPNNRPSAQELIDSLLSDDSMVNKKSFENFLSFLSNPNVIFGDWIDHRVPFLQLLGIHLWKEQEEQKLF